MTKKKINYVYSDIGLNLVLCETNNLGDKRFAFRNQK